MRNPLRTSILVTGLASTLACASTQPHQSGGGEPDAWLYRRWMGELDPSAKMGKGVTLNLKLDLQRDGRFEMETFMNASFGGGEEVSQKPFAKFRGSARRNGNTLMVSDLACEADGKPDKCPPFAMTVGAAQSVTVEIEGISVNMAPYDEAGFKALAHSPALKLPKFDLAATFPPGQGLALPAMFRNTHLGMNKAAFEAAAPELKDSSLEQGEDFNISKDLSYDRLNGVSLSTKATSFPRAEAFLEERWGKPIMNAEALVKEWHWLDREKGMRATLTKPADVVSIEYHLYKPIETLFPGKKPALPAALGSVTLGISRDELLAAIPAMKEFNSLDLRMEGYINAEISYEAATEAPHAVTLFRLSFSPIENLHDLLVKTWGPPLKNRKSKDDAEAWKVNAPYRIKDGPKMGFYVVYKAQPYGMSHALEYRADLP